MRRSSACCTGGLETSNFLSGSLFNRNFNYQEDGRWFPVYHQAVQLAGTGTDFVITRNGFAPWPGTGGRSILTWASPPDYHLMLQSTELRLNVVLLCNDAAASASVILELREVTQVIGTTSTVLAMTLAGSYCPSPADRPG